MLQLLLSQPLLEVQGEEKDGPGLGPCKRLPQFRDRSEKHSAAVASNQVFGESQHEVALETRYQLQQEVYHQWRHDQENFERCGLKEAS